MRYRLVNTLCSSGIVGFKVSEVITTVEAMPILPPASLDKQVRARIRAWLAGSGLTQTAFSDRIGKNQPWVSRYLKGEVEADLDTLQRMAEVFGHNLSTLLNQPSDPLELTLVELYRSVPARARATLLELLRHLARRDRTTR